MTKKLFEKYDTDRSGQLDREEMKIILDVSFKGMGIDKDHTKEEIDDFFKRTDSNGDGVISLHEYLDVIRSSLEKAGMSYEEFEETSKSQFKKWRTWRREVEQPKFLWKVINIYIDTEFP